MLLDIEDYLGHILVCPFPGVSQLDLSMVVSSYVDKPVPNHLGEDYTLYADDLKYIHIPPDMRGISVFPQGFKKRVPGTPLHGFKGSFNQT